MICSNSGKRLRSEYGIDATEKGWDDRCDELLEYPLKVYHKHMAATVGKISMLIIGCFVALLLCILRSLVVLERQDTTDLPVSSPSRPKREKKYYLGDRQSIRVYRHRT